MYKKVLDRMIILCYTHRRTCCFLGEWLIALVFLVWACWPLAAALIRPSIRPGDVLWSVPVTLFLAYKFKVRVKEVNTCCSPALFPALFPSSCSRA